MIRRLSSLALLLTLAAPAGARADEVTTCLFGSPTPGSRVIRVDLPHGTDFLALEPRGSRGSMAGGEESWHLAQGMFVVNAATLQLEAYRVEATGIAPRRYVIEKDGQTVVNQGVPGNDYPFYHTASRPRPGLRPGSYYLIGFGSDGSPSFPNDWWGGEVRIGGQHTCHLMGSGDVFDHDHTEFKGGTQVYARAAGHADEIELSMSTNRRLVVGLMDAGVQLWGEAELEYEMPSVSGEVDDEIEAFATIGGDMEFEARYTGLFPTILVAGVAIDV